MTQPLSDLTFKAAEASDAPAVTALINRAYRGESSRAGWTTEADLLIGLRIDEVGIHTVLNDPLSLLLLAVDAGTIVASIHGHLESDGVHFGLFAVEPVLQGRGVGKKLLKAAESAVKDHWGVTTAIMEVIPLRHELIRFYERHGYGRTGETLPFPVSPLWEPRGPELELAVLKKRLV